ncbi:response regulator [Plesiocystis pacifica SIR-1]|uniref:Response regulator n=1 Tax=Plesiocystis pacifica SIR-1 TaxID=391625 RepID=A6GAP9_9BACT|nr:response regulator [Plesiocystis pacifica]EDM77111.1 response regulator [Plesiocystis pacifica SIR-1]
MPISPPKVSPPKVGTGLGGGAPVVKASWKSALLIDPDEENRERVARILREAADQVSESEQELAIQEATNGTAAWALVERTRPDLIVAEILLEGMNGLQLLRRLKERYTDQAPRVMFVTYMSHEVDRYWALRNGATAFVIKPYEDDFLRDRSIKLLREDDNMGLDGNWPPSLS